MSKWLGGVAEKAPAPLTVEHIQGCPFCPSTDVEICRTNANACWVRCACCGADAEHHRTRKGAIANWNRRSGSIVWAKVVDDDEARQKEQRRVWAAEKRAAKRRR